MRVAGLVAGLWLGQFCFIDPAHGQGAAGPGGAAAALHPQSEGDVGITKPAPMTQAPSISIRIPTQLDTPLSYKIGRVETKNVIHTTIGQVGIGQATGVLISPCLMLTNAHVAIGSSPDTDEHGEGSITFFFGEGTTKFKWRVDGTPIYWATPTRQGAKDFALVRLDKCPGKLVGWLMLVPRMVEQMRLERLDLVGIAPETENGKVLVERNCQVGTRAPITGEVEHECEAVHGLSGAAMLNENGHLVAINEGTLSDGTNAAITIIDILADQKAKALIDSDIEAFAREQATTR